MGAAALVCRGRLDPIMVACAILAVDRGPWTVDRGPWTVDRGPWTVDRGPIVITRTCLRINLARLS